MVERKRPRRRRKVTLVVGVTVCILAVADPEFRHSVGVLLELVFKF